LVPVRDGNGVRDRYLILGIHGRDRLGRSGERWVDLVRDYHRVLPVRPPVIALVVPDVDCIPDAATPAELLTPAQDGFGGPVVPPAILAVQFPELPHGGGGQTGHVKADLMLSTMVTLQGNSNGGRRPARHAHFPDCGCRSSCPSSISVSRQASALAAHEGCNPLSPQARKDRSPASCVRAGDQAGRALSAQVLPRRDYRACGRMTTSLRSWSVRLGDHRSRPRGPTGGLADTVSVGSARRWCSSRAARRR
jgi:hypothetical protein